MKGYRKYFKNGFFCYLVVSVFDKNLFENFFSSLRRLYISPINSIFMRNNMANETKVYIEKK